MLVLGLTLAQAALLGGCLYFAARGHRYLAALVAGVNSSCGLAVGILTRNQLVIGVAAAGLAGFALFWWWGGPRGRKRASKTLGDESRQLRDGLVRRMRQRRVTRPRWSPSPSRAAAMSSYVSLTCGQASWTTF